MPKVWILNGPNLNMLGQRSTDLYGVNSYADLCKSLQDNATDLGIDLDCLHSNHEGDLIDWIQQAAMQVDGLIINAGGLTHTSVSVRDALEFLEIPKIEVHITNIYAREDFRRASLLAPVVNAMIAGFGQKGYILALEHIKTLI